MKLVRALVETVSQYQFTDNYQWIPRRMNLEDQSIVYYGDADPGISEQTDPPRFWVGITQS
ncbi:hypothetical protein GCM10028809_62410 [Spirosoma gilvum]